MGVDGDGRLQSREVRRDHVDLSKSNSNDNIDNNV